METPLESLSTVYSYYLKNYYRSKSFYLILSLVIVASILMVFMSIRYLPKIDALFSSGGPVPAILKDKVVLYLWSYVMSDLPVFAAVFFSSPAISSEIENRTAFHIFSLPLDRSVLLLGKYLAAASASLISMAVFIVAEIATALYLFPDISIAPIFVSFAMLVVFILAISAFTFMVSSFFNKNIYSYITTFIIYFIVFDAANLILSILYNYNAFFLLDNAASIIPRIFLNVSPTVFGSQFSLNGAPLGNILLSLSVMLLYIIISLVVALVIFERKEVR